MGENRKKIQKDTSVNTRSCEVCEIEFHPKGRAITCSDICSMARRIVKARHPTAQAAIAMRKGMHRSVELAAGIINDENTRALLLEILAGTYDASKRRSRKMKEYRQRNPEQGIYLLKPICPICGRQGCVSQDCRALRLIIKGNEMRGAQIIHSHSTDPEFLRKVVRVGNRFPGAWPMMVQADYLLRKAGYSSMLIQREAANA